MTSNVTVDPAKAKAIGQAVYTEDLQLPGMLVGKILRSSVPHARVKRIDVSKAEKRPEILAVVTGEEVKKLSHLYLGNGGQDEPVLVIDKARFCGDALAAVAAVDEQSAWQALELIDVEYDEIPSITDPRESMREGAPLIHESAASNVCDSKTFGWGDLKRGFQESDLVLESTFSFPSVFQHPMEPVGICVAALEGDRVILHTPDQRPLASRWALARIFGVDPRKIILRVPYIGGGFGSKYLKREAAIAILLALKTKLPVMMKSTMEESFLMDCRHSYSYRLKTGFKKDGTVLARDIEAIVNVGAYGSAPVLPIRRSAIAGAAPYRVPNYRLAATCVFTNTVPAGSFRSIGRPQVIWGCESQMDEAAERLGMDPVELRMKNLMERGESFPVANLPPLDADVKGGLEKTVAALNQVPPAQPVNKSKKRGRGIACSARPGGNESMNAAQAFIELAFDGIVRVITAGTEMGQGYQTMVRQVVSREMGIGADAVLVELADTAIAPFFYGTSATRTTYAMGTAVLEAARDLKRELLNVASKIWNVPIERLAIRKATVVDTGEEGRGIGFTEIVGLLGRGARIYGKGSYVSTKGISAISWEPCFSAVEVEVDTETGEVEVITCITAADVGHALDVQTCKGQVEGGAIMAMGHTLFEEMVYRDGQLLNGSSLSYRLPLLRDLARHQECILIENDDGPGPYGSRGVGNSSMNPIAPAVGNAIYHAIGVRIRDLPLTSERVFSALRQRGEQ